MKYKKFVEALKNIQDSEELVSRFKNRNLFDNQEEVKTLIRYIKKKIISLGEEETWLRQQFKETISVDGVSVKDIWDLKDISWSEETESVVQQILEKVDRNHSELYIYLMMLTEVNKHLDNPQTPDEIFDELQLPGYDGRNVLFDDVDFLDEGKLSS